MTVKRLLMAGYPNSGKTTFLAALYHTILRADADSVLSIAETQSSDLKYINKAHQRWLERKIPGVTKRGDYTKFRLPLEHRGLGHFVIESPDLSGELFRDDLSKNRACFEEDAQHYRNCDGALLFLNAADIDPGFTMHDRGPAAQIGKISQGEDETIQQVNSEQLGNSQDDKKTPIKWSTDCLPTQVAVLDLLQTLSRPPLGHAARKIALVISAWDRVGETTPDQYLLSRLPLLGQCLRYGENSSKFKAFGVSAQGGDFEDDADRKRLGEMDDAIQWITVQEDNERNLSLIDILVWLIE